MQTLKDGIREKIADAGLKEFSQNGYAKTSVRKIAEKAGVGVGNIYNYYSNKDELFKDILRPVTEEFDMLLIRLGRRYESQWSDPQEEYLRKSIEVHMGILARKRKLLKILLYQAQGSSLEHFKIDFTSAATVKVKEWFERNKLIHKSHDLKISDFMIHLHTVYLFTMLEEIVIHKIPQEEMEEIINTYMDIEISGWKKMLEIDTREIRH